MCGIICCAHGLLPDQEASSHCVLLHVLARQNCIILSLRLSFLLVQVEEMERGVLGSVPDKAGSSDYYSEGIIITDVADPYNCPLLWLNTICKEMLGASADCCMLYVSSWDTGA